MPRNFLTVVLARSAVVLLAVTASVIGVSARAESPSPAGAPVLAGALSLADAPSPGGVTVPLKVLFIGDSVMKAAGLDPSQAWPVLIGRATGWDITNLACNGAGFLQQGDPDDCASTFAGVLQSAATETPDVVVVEGSSNDFGLDNGDILAATVAAVAEARAEFPNAKIVGLSAVWGAEALPDQSADVDNQVSDAVTAVGGTFISIGQPLSGRYDLMQSDDIHPTAEGQAALAAVIVGPLRVAARPAGELLLADSFRQTRTKPEVADAPRSDDIGAAPARAGVSVSCCFPQAFPLRTNSFC